MPVAAASKPFRRKNGKRVPDPGRSSEDPTALTAAAGSATPWTPRQSRPLRPGSSHDRTDQRPRCPRHDPVTPTISTADTHGMIPRLQRSAPGTPAGCSHDSSDQHTRHPRRQHRNPGIRARDQPQRAQRAQTIGWHTRGDRDRDGARVGERVVSTHISALRPLRPLRPISWRGALRPPIRASGPRRRWRRGAPRGARRRGARRRSRWREGR